MLSPSLNKALLKTGADPHLDDRRDTTRRFISSPATKSQTSKEPNSAPQHICRFVNLPWKTTRLLILLTPILVVGELEYCTGLAVMGRDVQLRKSVRKHRTTRQGYGEKSMLEHSVHDVTAFRSCQKFFSLMLTPCRWQFVWQSCITNLCLELFAHYAGRI